VRGGFGFFVGLCLFFGFWGVGFLGFWFGCVAGFFFFFFCLVGGFGFFFFFFFLVVGVFCGLGPLPSTFLLLYFPFFLSTAACALTGGTELFFPGLR